MAFTNPTAAWYFLAIPIILMIALIMSFVIRMDRARFADPDLYIKLSQSVSRTKRNIGTIAFMGGLFFLVIAMTGPRFGVRTEIVQRAGVDVVIVLDTSYSMLAEDIKPSRIEQAKYEMNRFIDNLQGDRVAIVAFSGKALVQCPLTSDYDAAKTFLKFIDVGVVPSPGTDVEAALETALKLFETGSSSSGQSQLIILVSDGESISGDPEQAARKAHNQGIRIYTVGIGSPDGEIIPIRDPQGNLSDYKRDSSGNVVITKLDEKTLRSIATITEGDYLPTKNGEVDIQAIIDELGTMHRADFLERKISRLRERFQIPLGISLLFFSVWLITGERKEVSLRRKQLS